MRKNSVFEFILNLSITVNCIVIAMVDPTQSTESDWNTNLDLVEFVLLIIFTFEMVPLFALYAPSLADRYVAAGQNDGLGPSRLFEIRFQ